MKSKKLKIFYSDTNYKQGTKLKDNETNKVYIVHSCVSLEWLTGGDKKGYYVTLKEYYGN